MTVRLPSQRPGCEDIQKKTDFWALNEEGFEIDAELRGEIISKLNGGNLIFLVLKSKLNI